MKESYIQIQKKFNKFISIWQTKELSILEDIVFDDIRIYMNIAKNDVDGAQHSIYGLRKFILELPKTDDFKFEVCNYICRISKDEAQQYAEIQCTCLNTDGKNFRYVAMISNYWKLNNLEWKIDEMRMDISIFGGLLYQEYANVWYLESYPILTINSNRLPCIFPEIDSPWEKIKINEYFLDENELIKECLSKFSFGINHLMFKYVFETVSNDFELGNKISFISQLKFERQKYKYFCNTYKFSNLEVFSDNAYAVVESIVLNSKIINIKFVKSNNIWQIVSFY